jgi:hypothetical protein
MKGRKIVAIGPWAQVARVLLMEAGRHFPSDEKAGGRGLETHCSVASHGPGCGSLLLLFLGGCVMWVVLLGAALTLPWAQIYAIGYSICFVVGLAGGLIVSLRKRGFRLKVLVLDTFQIAIKSGFICIVWPLMVPIVLWALSRPSRS